jgi:hypothetical protein
MMLLAGYSHPSTAQSPMVYLPPLPAAPPSPTSPPIRPDHLSPPSPPFPRPPLHLEQAHTLLLGVVRWSARTPPAPGAWVGVTSQRFLGSVHLVPAKNALPESFAWCLHQHERDSQSLQTEPQSTCHHVQKTWWHVEQLAQLLMQVLSVYGPYMSTQQGLGEPPHTWGNHVLR